MRVLAINQFYAPDAAATAQLLTQLCEDLVSGGDEVTVLCSRQHYAQPGPAQQDARPPHERLNGVKVVRPVSSTMGRHSTLPRLLDDSTFLVSAAAHLIAAQEPDVILALSSPPMLAVSAAEVARVRGIPLVCWVHDVYPDIAEALGALSPRIAAGLQRLMQRALSSADRVVGLSQGMAARLQSYDVSPPKLQVIENWADGHHITPLPQRDSDFARRHNLHGRFVVMYSGTLGRAHEADTLVAAARLLRLRCPNAVMVFVGGGARTAAAKAHTKGWDNVRWLPPQPRQQLRDSLAAAHVHLASLQPAAEGWLVPSKLYGVMAAGRPLIYVGPRRCEVARVVLKEGIGWVVAPGDAEALAGRVAALSGDETALLGCGDKARRVFEARYDRPQAVKRWRHILAEAASGRAAD